ncbi:MAG TPA: hypothetical protein VHH12_07475, partial [Mycobacterium sp.]|nr:hypothetical protein [Mycobacterium sp.]
MMRSDDSPPSTSDSQGVTDRSEPAAKRPAASDDRPRNHLGRDASGSNTRSGPKPNSWRRNLYALFATQMLAIVAFSLRAPFLPFYIDDLGADTTEAQALWAGWINAAGAGVMAITAPIWGAIAD